MLGGVTTYRRAPVTQPLDGAAPALTTSPAIVDSIAIPRLELAVEREAGKPTTRVVVVEGDVCRVGSHAGNEVVLADPLVSRFHFRLTRVGGAWRLVDTGSLNGTRVAGLRVREADLASPSCRVELGESIVALRELRSAARVELPVWPRFGELYGTSAAMRALFGVLERVAKSDANVLVEGESGTGKELVATEIVQHSARADGPFVIVDCGAIAPSLLESELFGHVRGAFSGADRDRVGAFEAAHGGTLLLDEIGELPLDKQPKLLRAIEAREVRRVGETRARKVDVRILAATNRRLEREVNHGRFREDLFYRLSVVSVRVPPLRERLEDVSMLVDVFLGAIGDDRARDLFTPAVRADLARHDWPGNVRELRNYVERAAVLEVIGPARRARTSSLPAPPMPAAAVDLDVPFTVAKDDLVADFERRYLGALLEAARGNVSRAARKAGMDRMYLYRLLQTHGLREGGLREGDKGDPRDR
jgi:DNA-binding NtrC family response regulator